jgi:hypothetical protein
MLRPPLYVIKPPVDRFTQYGEQSLKNDEKLQAVMTCVT